MTKQCSCGCGREVLSPAKTVIFSEEHFLMFNKQDKRSFAVKKWLLTVQGLKEEEITEEIFKEARTRYYSGANSPWGRAKNKGEEHYNAAKQNHFKGMDRSNWESYINPFSKQYFIEKGLSLEQAEYEVKARNKFCKEFWEKRGYPNAEKIARQFNPGSYEYYKGKVFSRVDLINKNNPTYIEYWLNLGHDEMKAKQLQARFKPYCDEFWLECGKTDEYILDFRKANLKKSISSYGGCSSIANQLFTEIGIKGHYGPDEIIIQLTKDESEKSGRKFIRPDFICGHKIIEFFGDYYHANPTIFSSDTVFKRGDAVYTALNVWDGDANRISVLLDKGYEVLVIWESEYLGNKEATIEKCKNFLS